MPEERIILPTKWEQHVILIRIAFHLLLEFLESNNLKKTPKPLIPIMAPPKKERGGEEEVVVVMITEET